MEKRPLCKVCQSRPRAVAYHKYERVYYRSMCDACIRKGKRIKPAVPRWQSSGYKKKKECDRCGFRARVSAQLSVYHVDGNLNNIELRNLKTICLNCIMEVNKLNLPWKAGDLEPDY
jgi:hypothetical protein